MADVPEHLLKRAEEAKARAAAKKAEAAGAAAPPPAVASPAAAEGAPAADDAAATASYADAEKTGKIPAHLLERSAAAKAAKAQGGGGDAAPASGGGGGGVATVERPGAAAATAALSGTAAAGLVGPAGHTQRLLTVVKAGSIQDVKASPVDKVNTWPHLIVGEFVASLLCTAFLLVFSAFVRAPLLALANYNQTPNPSKAPWYFLGLQELLTMFHPMVAGVTIPGMGMFILILAPFGDRNPSNKPEDRKFAISLFTVFMMFWTVLVIIGSFFRGPGFIFVLPWNKGLFFDF